MVSSAVTYKLGMHESIVYCLELAIESDIAITIKKKSIHLKNEFQFSF